MHRRMFANPGTINSFRAEESGAAHMLVEESLVPKQYFCDNQSVVNAIKSTTTLPPLCPEWDLLEPSRLWALQHSIECVHVKGHQDKEKREDESDTLAKLNIYVDKEAEKAVTLPPHRHLTPGHRITLKIQGIPMTTKYKFEIKRVFNSPSLRHHFITKYGLKGDVVDWIDFDAFSHYIKKKHIARKHRILKLVYGWLPNLDHQKKYFVRQIDVLAVQKKQSITSSNVHHTAN